MTRCQQHEKSAKSCSGSNHEKGRVTLTTEWDERMRSLCARMTYRDWTIAWTGVNIRVAPPGEMKPDSYRRPDFKQVFYDFVYVDKKMTDAEIARRVLAYILALEEHEVFEFMRLDDKPVINPHKSVAAFHGNRRGYFVEKVDGWR